MRRLVAGGWIQRDGAAAGLDVPLAEAGELMPRPGDTVRFRYTPNLHTVVNVRDSHDGAIAVLERRDEHGVPLGGFAVRADDLRIVERRTNR